MAETTTSHKGSYEWTMPNFIHLTGKHESATFSIGGYDWRLWCYPLSVHPNRQDHVSLFLWYPDAGTCPPGSPLCPDATFTLRIVNHKNRQHDYIQSTSYKFDAQQHEWGMPQYISRDKLTAETGLLTANGSIVLHVELEVKNPSPLYGDPERSGVAWDLLALLDNDPGATSDLTIIAGGSDATKGTTSSGAAAVSSTSTGSRRRKGRESSRGARGLRSGGGQDDSGGEAGPEKSSFPRSFRVHRAVLAARCPFFRTLFNAGMADSAARELPLPDADPDAFAVLLRYLYGGHVPLCERAVHRAAIPLCDTLLLPKVKDALEQKLVKSANADTITADLLWAAGHNNDNVVEELVAVYKRVAKDVDPAQVVAMAAASLELVARVLIGVTQEPGRGQGQEQQEGQQQDAGGKGEGGRKRARS